MFQENARLQEQSEDLQAQVLHKHLVEGTNLLANGQGSLASEMANHSRDEVKCFLFIWLLTYVNYIQHFWYICDRRYTTVCYDKSVELYVT